MTEKAAEAETSGPHCLKVFLVLTENLLKKPCRIMARQKGSEGNFTLFPYLKIAAHAAVCHALSFACPRVDTHFTANRVGGTATLASGLW